MQKIKTALLSYGMSGKYSTLLSGFTFWFWNNRRLGNATKTHPIRFPWSKKLRHFRSFTPRRLRFGNCEYACGTHYEYAKQVLLAGKHAIVEKLSTTVAKAKNRCFGQRKKDPIGCFSKSKMGQRLQNVQKNFRTKSGDIVEAEIHFDRYNPNLSPKSTKKPKMPVLEFWKI